MLQYRFSFISVCPLEPDVPQSRSVKLDLLCVNCSVIHLHWQQSPPEAELSFHEPSIQCREHQRPLVVQSYHHALHVALPGFKPSIGSCRCLGEILKSLASMFMTMTMTSTIVCVPNYDGTVSPSAWSHRRSENDLERGRLIRVIRS
jgi:hypothetical protein